MPNHARWVSYAVILLIAAGCASGGATLSRLKRALSPPAAADPAAADPAAPWAKDASPNPSGSLKSPSRSETPRSETSGPVAPGTGPTRPPAEEKTASALREEPAGEESTSPHDLVLDLPLSAEEEEQPRKTSLSSSSVPTPFVYDVPIVRNAAVDRWIDYFTGPARKRFSIWLRRSGRYMPTFRRVLRENNLPEDLAYLPLIESGYSLRARSRAGAVGPWQFMRGTARRNGLKVNRYLDERRDPVKATQAAATYLSALYAEFGDWHLALAAYNSGENRVRRVLRRTGRKTYWAIARTRRLPNETRNYIPKFLAGMIIAKNPEVFGFAGIDYDEPLRYDTVALPRGMSLRHAARLAGAPLKEMADLNAELRWYITPPVSGHLLRLPPGSAARFLDALSRSPQESFPAKGRYRILPGDTLGSLAARFGVSLKGLLEINAHLDPRRLRVGTEILMPGRAAARSLVAARNPASAPSGGGNPPPQGRYRIRPGDTLGGIAQRFGLTLKEIAGLNPRVKSKYLRVGSEIRLPARPAGPTRQETAKASFIQAKKTGATGGSGQSGPALNGKAPISLHTVSLRNQPEASGGVMPHGIALISCSPNISSDSSRPPPWYIQPRNSGASGPNGTVVKKLNAISVPAKNPGLDHAASTEPFETAGIASRPGTSAPGSNIFNSSVPPDRRFTFSVNLTPAAPINASDDGNTLVICSVTFSAAMDAPPEGVACC